MARLGLQQLEQRLTLVRMGLLAVPLGIDVGDFFVQGTAISPPMDAFPDSSGGDHSSPLASPPPRSPEASNSPKLWEAIEDYLGRLQHLAKTHRDTKRTHLNHLRKHVRRNRKLAEIHFADLDRYLQRRLRQRSAETVKKERDTLIDFFSWAARCEYIAESPAQGLPVIKSQRNQDPFKTVAEIEESIRRGGLARAELKQLWKALYLTPTEIAEVLQLVEKNARDPASMMLHSIAAFTGMRRGEILRLRWSDVDLAQRTLIARSLKQSRHVSEVTRRIDLHGGLAERLEWWRRQSTRGQHVLVEQKTTRPISPRSSITLFYGPLRHTRWCLDKKKSSYKIGYHTYRHSFASNLAAAGVDQRVIDEWMGHTTEAMRKRYRHLFPNQRRAAIDTLAYQSPDGPWYAQDSGGP